MNNFFKIFDAMNIKWYLASFRPKLLVHKKWCYKVSNQCRILDNWILPPFCMVGKYRISLKYEIPCVNCTSFIFMHLDACFCLCVLHICMHFMRNLVFVCNVWVYMHLYVCTFIQCMYKNNVCILIRKFR